MRSPGLEYEVAAAFACDVTDHRMIVKLDHGLHRHLVFQQREHPWYCWFELITAPGSLTITGDHGGHIFRRTADMFEFFRSSGNAHRINPSYWAEKTPDYGRSVKVYSRGVFDAMLFDAVNEWAESYEDRLADYYLAKAAYEKDPVRKRSPVEPKSPDHVRELIDDHVRYGPDTEDEEGARELLRELESIGVTSDTWEWDLTGWDYHFLWCLHAIAWGVRQYDEAVKSGLHVVRTGTTAWDVPLPTTAPAPASPPKHAVSVREAARVATAVPAGGVL